MKLQTKNNHWHSCWILNWYSLTFDCRRCRLLSHEVVCLVNLGLSYESQPKTRCRLETWHTWLLIEKKHQQTWWGHAIPNKMFLHDSSPGKSLHQFCFNGNFVRVTMTDRFEKQQPDRKLKRKCDYCSSVLVCAPRSCSQTLAKSRWLWWKQDFYAGKLLCDGAFHLDHNTATTTKNGILTFSFCWACFLLLRSARFIWRTYVIKTFISYQQTNEWKQIPKLKLVIWFHSGPVVFNLFCSTAPFPQLCLKIAPHLWF